LHDTVLALPHCAAAANRLRNMPVRGAAIGDDATGLVMSHCRHHCPCRPSRNGNTKPARNCLIGIAAEAATVSAAPHCRPPPSGLAINAIGIIAIV